MQEPAEGHPDFLVAEIHLPKIVRLLNHLSIDCSYFMSVLAINSLQHVYIVIGLLQCFDC